MATLYIEAMAETRGKSVSRRHRRSTVSLPALISVLGERHSAQIHNLSAAGAMVQSRCSVDMEDHIFLICGSVERLGRVAWARHDCFGVEFLHSIEQHEVDCQIDRSEMLASLRKQRASGSGAQAAVDRAYPARRLRRP